MLGSIVIVNYITVKTDSKTSINSQNMLFVMLSQDVHNKMPVLSSEETLLMTAKIIVRKCDSSTSKSARKPE